MSGGLTDAGLLSVTSYKVKRCDQKALQCLFSFLAGRVKRQPLVTRMTHSQYFSDRPNTKNASHQYCLFRSQKFMCHKIQIVLCHKCNGILWLNICGLFLLLHQQKAKEEYCEHLNILNCSTFAKQECHVRRQLLKGLETDAATKGDFHEIISNILNI